MSGLVKGIAVCGPRPTREEWLQLRLKGIGASDMAAVMGYSPYTSAYALWWEKHEGWIQDEETEAQHHGKGLEDYVASEYEALIQRENTGVARTYVHRPPSAMYRHAEHEWMLATPDRLLWTEGGHPYEPIEIKTDEAGAWGPQGTDEIPYHHKIQVTQQMAVLGAERAHVVRFARKRLTHYTVRFDGPLFAQMVTAGEMFMASLRAGNPPPVDASKSTEDALIRLHHAIDEAAPPVMFDHAFACEFARAKGNLRQAKERLKTLENTIRETLGDSPHGADASTGDIFVTRTITPRRGYTVEPTEVDMLRLKQKKDHK